MKKSDALKQTRAGLNQKQQDLIDLAKKENNRAFTDVEDADFDARTLEIRSLDSQIEREVEKENVEERTARAAAASGAGASTSEQREISKIAERFSIVKALRDANPANRSSNGILSGIEKEVNEMGIAECRAAGVKIPDETGFTMPMAVMNRATSQTVSEDSGSYGGALVQDNGPRIIDGLRPRLFLEDLGATFLTGLSGGDVPLVVANDFAMAFMAETATITVEKKTFAGPTLTAKRAGGAVDISNRLLMQESVDVNAMVMAKLRNGFANLLNSSSINGAGGVAPTGLLSVAGVNVSTQAAAGAATWAAIVELQALIEEDDATETALGYLMSPKLKAALKQVKKDAGSGRFLFEEGFVDGIKALSSSLVPTLDASGTAVFPLIYGDFSQMTIGQWGGLNISVNPYSADLSNSVRLVLNTYADMAVANPKAFAKNALLTA